MANPSSPRSRYDRNAALSAPTIPRRVVGATKISHRPAFLALYRGRLRSSSSTTNTTFVFAVVVISKLEAQSTIWAGRPRVGMKTVRSGLDKAELLWLPLDGKISVY